MDIVIVPDWVSEIAESYAEEIDAGCPVAVAIERAVMQALEAEPGEGVLADPGRLVTAISAWLDASYQGISEEAHLVRRCVKAASEVGEMIDALYGMLGENPRKGVTHTRDDLIRELLDVALAALGAVEHVDGNRGTALDLLAGHIQRVAERAAAYGLVLPAEPAAVWAVGAHGPDDCGDQRCEVCWLPDRDGMPTARADVLALPPEPPVGAVVEVLTGEHQGRRFMAHPGAGIYTSLDTNAIVFWSYVLHLAGPQGVRVVGDGGPAPKQAEGSHA